MTFDDILHTHHAGQWKFGIRLRDRVAQSRGHAIRVASCANHERKGRHRALKERLVDFRVIAGSFGVGFHVGDDSDDLAPFWRTAARIHADLFSERVLVLQMAMCKLLVYHHY